MDKVFGFIQSEDEENGRKYYAGRITKKYAGKLKRELTLEDFEKYEQGFRKRGRPRKNQ